MRLKDEIPRFIQCANLVTAYAVTSLICSLDESRKREDLLRSNNLLSRPESIITLEVTDRKVILHRAGKQNGSPVLHNACGIVELITCDPLMLGEYEVTTNRNGIRLDNEDFIEWDLARELAALDPKSGSRSPKNKDPIMVFNFKAIPRTDGLVVGCQFIPWEQVRRVAALDPSKKKPAQKSAKNQSKKRPVRSVKKKK